MKSKACGSHINSAVQHAHTSTTFFPYTSNNFRSLPPQASLPPPKLPALPSQLLLGKLSVVALFCLFSACSTPLPLAGCSSKRVTRSSHSCFSRSGNEASLTIPPLSVLCLPLPMSTKRLHWYRSFKCGRMDQVPMTSNLPPHAIYTKLELTRSISLLSVSKGCSSRSLPPSTFHPSAHATSWTAGRLLIYFCGRQVLTFFSLQSSHTHCLRHESDSLESCCLVHTAGTVNSPW